MTNYWTDDLRDEARKDWQTVLDGLVSIARHRARLDGPHGATNPVAAAHTGIRGPGMTPDGAPAMAPAPDPFTGQYATIRRRRNKRGATATVTHVGRAFVSGPEPTGVRDVTGRVASVRFDAVTLAHWADRILETTLADDETLASAGLALVGTVQGASWEQVTRAEGSREAVALAQHRTDLTGGIVDARRVTLTTAARADHRYRPSHTPALGNTLADAIASDLGRPVRAVKAWPVRAGGRNGNRGLGTPRARKADVDVAAVDRIGRDGKARTVLTLTGRTPDGALVTYADRIVTRRTPDGRPVTLTDTGAFITDDDRPFTGRVIWRSAPPERVAVGIVWRDRPSGDTRTARERERTATRERATIVRAAARLSDDGAAIVGTWDALAEGERATVTLASGATLAFTRHDGRPVTYRYVAAGDDAKVRPFTARTPVAAAIRVARMA